MEISSCPSSTSTLHPLANPAVEKVLQAELARVTSPEGSIDFSALANRASSYQLMFPHWFATKTIKPEGWCGLFKWEMAPNACQRFSEDLPKSLLSCSKGVFRGVILDSSLRTQRSSTQELKTTGTVGKNKFKETEKCQVDEDQVQLELFPYSDTPTSEDLLEQGAVYFYVRKETRQCSSVRVFASSGMEQICRKTTVTMERGIVDKQSSGNESEVPVESEKQILFDECDEPNKIVSSKRAASR